MSDYDSWKLATPPEYEDGELFVCDACECASPWDACNNQQCPRYGLGTADAEQEREAMQ